MGCKYFALTSYLPLFSLGPAMRKIVSILNPIYWTTAKEIGEAVNGFTLTNAVFTNDLSGVSDCKEPAYSERDLVLIPGLTIQLIMDWRRQQLYPQL